MINDEAIQKVISNELIALSHDPDPSVRENAAYSLELIANEVYQLEIFNKLYNLFQNLRNKVETKVKLLQTYYIHSFQMINKFYSFIQLMFTNTNNILISHHFHYLNILLNTLEPMKLIPIEE